MSQKQLILSLATLNSYLVRQVEQSLYVHGISFSEYLVMDHLVAAPKKCMRRIDLAEKVGLSASGVTRLLNPMEKNRLVVKESNPRDARVSLVKLSKTGEQLLADANVSLEHSAERLLHRLSPKKQTQFLDLIHELLA